MKGQLFGEADVINNRPYTTSVCCLSNVGEVYCIKAEEFLHKFSKDDKSWVMLVDRIKHRDVQIKSKIKNNVITKKLANEGKELP